jgi:[ribosomal protein S5]-alanine N-acetyltransferase
LAVNVYKFFSKFPTIDLGSIRLRDLMLSDKEEYYAMMSDHEVVQYLSDEDIPTSVESAEQEIKFWGGLFYRKQSVFWALADTSNDKFIGTIGYNSWNIHNRRAEISYDLMRDHWRKGIMTKALNNALIFGFQQMDLMRIEARTMIGNIPSQKILEKVGFKKEATLRSYRMIRGEPTDVLLYSLVRSDFAAFLA